MQSLDAGGGVTADHLGLGDCRQCTEAGRNLCECAVVLEYVGIGGDLGKQCVGHVEQKPNGIFVGRRHGIDQTAK